MEKLKENTDILDTKNASFKYGAIGGIAISIVLLLFQLSGESSPFLKQSGLLIFGLILIYALNKFFSQSQGRTFFNAIGFGLKTSLTAAIVVVVANVLLFAINPDISFSKYALEPETFIKLMGISGILLFEVFVFGSLISFITLQYLKNPK